MELTKQFVEGFLLASDPDVQKLIEQGFLPVAHQDPAGDIVYGYHIEDLLSWLPTVLRTEVIGTGYALTITVNKGMWEACYYDWQTELYLCIVHHASLIRALVQLVSWHKTWSESTGELIDPDNVENFIQGTDREPAEAGCALLEG